MIIIPIGGWCGTSTATRYNIKIYEKSLPFDFIRITFDGIIDNINNNFLNFITKKNPDYIVNNIKLFIENKWAFYNHDILSLPVIESFNRKCIRFIDLITDNDNIIFIRAITSSNMSNEYNKRDLFFDAIKTKNPKTNAKIVFIGHRDDDNINKIYYERLDERSCIFLLGHKLKFENNYVNYYTFCIQFIIKHSFLPDKLVINLNNYDNFIKITDNANLNDINLSDNNFFKLDDFTNIIPK